MEIPAGNGVSSNCVRTFVTWRQERREMKSVQDTGGRWTLHGFDASASASASDREDANRRTVGARKDKRDDPIRKSRVKESQDPRRGAKANRNIYSGACGRTREKVQGMEIRFDTNVESERERERERETKKKKDEKKRKNRQFMF